MDHAAYATYLGTLLTLLAAIRDSDRSLARQIIRGALCVDGEDRFAMLIAIDDASAGRRRAIEDLLGALRERMRFAVLAAA